MAKSQNLERGKVCLSSSPIIMSALRFIIACCEGKSSACCGQPTDPLPQVSCKQAVLGAHPVSALKCTALSNGYAPC